MGAFQKRVRKSSENTPGEGREEQWEHCRKRLGRTVGTLGTLQEKVGKSSGSTGNTPGEGFEEQWEQGRGVILGQGSRSSSWEEQQELQGCAQEFQDNWGMESRWDLMDPEAAGIFQNSGNIGLALGGGSPRVFFYKIFQFI